MKCSAGRNRGFTLLEVMITVTIVAILAAIAVPAYMDYIRRGKIVDATVRLGDYRAQMEKWFLDNRSYQPVPPAGTTCGVAPPPVGANDPFQIDCAANTATTYTITATGRAAGGMPALVYSVDQANVRGSTGAGGWANSVGACWAVRKDGSCQ